MRASDITAAFTEAEELEGGRGKGAGTGSGTGRSGVRVFECFDCFDLLTATFDWDFDSTRER